MEDSDDTSEHENLEHLFTSSDSSDNKFKTKTKTNPNKNLSKPLRADANLNSINSPNNSHSHSHSHSHTKNATTGMDIIDNDLPEFIDEDEETNKNKEDNESTTETISSQVQPTPPNSPGSKNKKVKNDTITGMVENMLKKDDKNVNGWDNDANITITNWYKTFKQQSFIYQAVLDKNRKMSDRLAVASIISSALLGIFSGFKLWIENDAIFQTVSNILLM